MKMAISQTLQPPTGVVGSCLGLDRLVKHLLRIEHDINEGKFNNPSEVLRAGIRHLEKEENKVIALRKAIENGLDSGRAMDFDPRNHLATLKAKRKADC